MPVVPASETLSSAKRNVPHPIKAPRRPTRGPAGYVAGLARWCDTRLYPQLKLGFVTLDLDSGHRSTKIPKNGWQNPACNCTHIIMTGGTRRF